MTSSSIKTFLLDVDEISVLWMQIDQINSQLNFAEKRLQACLEKKCVITAFS